MEFQSYLIQEIKEEACLQLIPLGCLNWEDSDTNGECSDENNFGYFKDIFSSQIKDDCQPYAVEMLLPLYKVCEGFARKIVSDDIKQLAQEVRASMENTMGKRTSYKSIIKQEKFWRRRGIRGNKKKKSWPSLIRVLH
ncbi:hypothetical protein RJ641_027186 [Dillenia turbinata]|uniref:Uncharacterized protein n=1 Tax=Dillenia turbinata TaxID=194707 RepID=A0AAN8W1X9_9MAGN